MSLIGLGLTGLGVSLGSQLLSPVINGIGNLISGGTWKQSGQELAQQQFNHDEAILAHERSIAADATKYQRAVEDLESAGLNPGMVYGSGGINAQGPTSSSASAGSGSRSNFQNNMNVLSGMSNLINSVTNARSLDFSMNKKSMNTTTQKIYNSVGDLMSTLVRTNDSMDYK